MKNLWIILLLVMGVFQITAQTTQDCINTLPPVYLKWNNQFYENNMQGLNRLMQSVRYQDPDLYREVAPTFLAMRKNHREAIGLMVVSGGVGLTLMIVGGLREKTVSQNQFGSRVSFQESDPNWGLMGAGAGLTLIGSLLAVTKLARANDILDFMNLFNQKSKNGLIDLTLRPSINTNHAGLMLTWAF